MFQGQVYVCRPNLASLCTSFVLAGIEKGAVCPRRICERQEVAEGFNSQQLFYLSFCDQPSEKKVLASCLHWNLLKNSQKHLISKGALWLTCVDANCTVALFWKLLRWFLMLWLQFVPAAMTMSGLLDLEVLTTSKVWLYMPPVPQIHTPTQTYL